MAFAGIVDTTEAPRAAHADMPAWQGFAGSAWKAHIDVAEFIRCNVQPYTGGAAFARGATTRTARLWRQLGELFELERAVEILDVSRVPSSITAHAPGYIDRELELIVGLQTDAPLRRAIFPNGGYRVIAETLETYGYGVDHQLEETFTRHRKTHNDGVLDVYPTDVLEACACHILTGVPDAFGRGRIVGDYRRVALYGVERLLAQKRLERASLDAEPCSESIIREREELAEQLRALYELLSMAAAYGHDISHPASSAREAVQWLYFGYLAAIKEQNGVAMAIGRVSTFLDCYFARDLARGSMSESEAQELIDDLVIKLRLVRFLRPAGHDAGDPTWITETIGGLADDGRPLVTKTSFRFLQTLYNLGPAPEPNLTVLWSPHLPDGFKRFCARASVETSSVQYASDELLRQYCGDDAAIACCVSSVRVGKQMQFFGARINLAKCLLHAINGGRDELTGQQVMPPFDPVAGDVLELDDVLHRMDHAMSWLARTFVNAMNCIHYMHDKYAYERLAMALHDRSPLRTMAFGIAGLAVAADSLSAIEHARVEVVRDATGLVVGYRTTGSFPRFGSDDDRVDTYARRLVRRFMAKLRLHPTYRDAMHTQSVLTVTASTLYGKFTGSTPDGRRAGEPLSPSATPSNGRDEAGLIASVFSVAKIPYAECQDGISFTANLTPESLGTTREAQIQTLVKALDTSFRRGLFHINVNVLSRATLVDAMAHPERYLDVSVTVSGTAVPFLALTHEQQHDVITGTLQGPS